MALFDQDMTFPQQGLFFGGMPNTKLPMIDGGVPPAALAQQAAPLQQQMPQQQEDPVMAALNNPMLQLGLNLLGSSRNANPWGDALNHTLAAQFQAAKARQAQAAANLDNQRVGLEGKRVDLEDAREKRKAGIEERRLQAEEAMNAARLPLLEAQGRNYNSEITARNAQIDLERQKLDLGNQQRDRENAFYTKFNELFSGGGQSTSQPPQTTPAPSSTEGGGYPRNNPGNIRPVGATTGFQAFKSPEEGIQAIDQNLLAYKNKHGINTLAGVIKRWSPPNENPTPQLIANAALRTGFNPDDPIDLENPQTLTKVRQAIIAQEYPNAPKNEAPKPKATNVSQDDLGQLAVVAGINGVKGAQQIMDYAKLRQPTVSAPGSIVRDIDGNVTRLPESPLKEREVAVQEGNLTRTTEKTKQELKEADTKRAETQANAVQEYKAATGTIDRLGQNAQELLAHPGLEYNTGWYGAVGANKIPNTAGKDASALLDTLKNKVVVNTLADLKKASENGASGFGQLSEKEGDRLENVIASLDRAQSLPAMKKALQGLVEFANTSKASFAERYQSLYGEVETAEPPSPSQGPVPAETMSLDDYLKSRSPKTAKK